MPARNPFLRESSGLVKRVGLLDAVMFNLGNMSVGLALFTSISPYISRGGVLWLASLIAMALSLPQLYLYTRLMEKIPRTGGDYIWLSRILYGPLGFVFALAFMIEATAYFALVAFFSASSINAVLSTIGAVNHAASYTALADSVFVDPYGAPTLAQRLLFYGVAAAAFALIIGVNIARPKWGYKLLTGLGLFSTAATALAMVVLALGAGAFSESIKPLLQQAAVSSSPGGSPWPQAFSFTATLALIPLFALFVYPWLTAAPSAAAEIRGQKALKHNLWIAYVLAAAFATLGFLELDLIAGYDFNINAYTTFAYNFWTAAMAVAGNIVLQWLIGLGLIAWNFFVLAYGVISFSRYIFAMAFDRIMPEIFARLNKAGAPVYTHLLDLALTLALLAIPVFSVGAAVSLYGAIIVTTIYFIAVGLAGLVLGLRSGERGLAAAGALMSAYFAWLTYVSATNPLFGFVKGDGQPNPVTLVFVLASFLAGIPIYLISWSRHRKMGLDVNAAFREIPPE